MSETNHETEGPTGVVLAGGYSRRFGERDKALARLDGRPLLARVATRLAEVTDRTVVNCRTDQREAFADALDSSAGFDSAATPVRFVADPVADRGPLFGFRTALREVETETCALAACDCPFLDPRLLSDLAERLDDDPDADVTAVRTGDRLRPTQAVYRTSPARRACDALLDAGAGRLSALFDRLDARVVPAEAVCGDAARSLFDVDTPADRERAVEMLDRETSAEHGDETPTGRELGVTARR